MACAAKSARRSWSGYERGAAGTGFDQTAMLAFAGGIASFFA
jgi:hypothetical protein